VERSIRDRCGHIGNVQGYIRDRSQSIRDRYGHIGNVERCCRALHDAEARTLDRHHDDWIAAWLKTTCSDTYEQTGVVGMTHEGDDIYDQPDNDEDKVFLFYND